MRAPGRPHRLCVVACRVVVLVSGSGTLLQALLDAARGPKYPAEIVAVGSDRADAHALARAQAAKVATFVHPLARGADRGEWDRKLTEVVEAFEPELIVSAGFMKLVGADFLGRFGGRMINTHPSLLPAFPGMHAPRDALAHGVKVTGATVFGVDEGVDTGPILAQEPVRVLATDTVETLHERIKVVERELLVATVARLATEENYRDR